jgi:hypothetical protein
LNDPFSIQHVTIRMSRSRLNGQIIDFIRVPQNLPVGKGKTTKPWRLQIKKAEKSWTSQLLLDTMRDVTISSTWIMTAEESRMSAFPVTDTRSGEVLAARGVPREQWRNDQQWVRFSLHLCQKYRHRPADSTSLPLVRGKLASKGQTAAQRAQAPCAVEYDSVFLSSELPSLRDDDAVAPPAPKDGEDGLASRQQESVIGPSPRREEPAHVLVQANGASAQTNAAWREVEAKLKDEILLRHDSPTTLQAYAGWMRKFRGFMVKTHPAELTGAEAKRFLADLAVRRQVSAAAHNQAFNALLFRCRHVCTQELGDLSDTPRAKRRTYIPTALSRQEVAWLLAELKEPSA